MSGFAPLTYETIEAWSRLRGVEVAPHEVETLLLMDAVLLNPGTGEEK